MLSFFDSGSGRDFVLPLVCVLGLALTTLISGVVAAGKEAPFWTRTFWVSMALFLFATALLIGHLSHWAFSLILILPAGLFFFLFRAASRRKHDL